MSNRNTILIFLLTGFFCSCHDVDIDKVNGISDYTPEVALAIGESTLRYRDSTELPPDLFLDSMLSDIEILDSLEINLSKDFFERDQVCGIDFRLNLFNFFPFASEIKLYYLDEDSVRIDLFQSPISLSAASVDSLGYLLDSVSAFTDVVLTEDQIDDIYQVDYIYVCGTIFNVTLLPYFIDQLVLYEIRAKVGAKVHIKIDANDF